MHHLTPAQLDAYRGRSLEPEALLDADLHLEDCAQCRAQLVPGKTHLAAFLPATGSPHLSYEQLEAYVDGKLAPNQRSAVVTHLELCPQCQSEADDLALFRRDFRPPRIQNSNRRLFVIGALAAAALVAIVLRQPPPKPPDQYAGLVDRTLSTGRIGIPASVLALRGQAGTLRGPASTTFGLVSPQATAVPETDPELSWTSAGAAASYVVSVFDQNQQRVAQSGPLAALGWKVSPPLRRGQVYQWQVRARLEGDKTVVAPGPQGPAAQFLVLDDAQAAKLQDAAGKYAEDHLLLGILYGEAGALDQAKRELKAALPRSAPLLEALK